MNIRAAKSVAIVLASTALVLIAEPAHAFRCGNKIVRDGMHEQQVIQACGEPTTKRFIGRAIRGVDVPFVRYRTPGDLVYRTPGYSHFVTEVIITEYIYNFGPRKLMRRLLFEGGVLVHIDTIGYGYLEK